MAKVIHYVKIKDSKQASELIKSLKYLKKDDLEVAVVAACNRIIEKAYSGRYLILDGTYHVSPTEQMVFIIQNASVWNNEPKSYRSCKRDDYRVGLPTVNVSIEYNKFFEILKSIFNTNLNLNSQKDGKDQDQLQGETNSDSGCYKGSILYCGRNRPQLTAGRHCDQARVEIQRTRATRCEIYISTRRPEILGSRLSDRQSQGVPREGNQAPGRVGIPSYCSGIKTHIDPVGISIRLLPSKEDCTQIGDAYRAKDGTTFVATKFDGQLGLVFSMIYDF